MKCCHFSTKGSLWVCRDVLKSKVIFVQDEMAMMAQKGQKWEGGPQIRSCSSAMVDLGHVFFVFNFDLFLHWAHTEEAWARRSPRIPQPHRSKSSLGSSWRPCKDRRKVNICRSARFLLFTAEIILVYSKVMDQRKQEINGLLSHLGLESIIADRSCGRHASLCTRMTGREWGMMNLRTLTFLRGDDQRSYWNGGRV